jgi:hypothetical protein
LGLGLAFSPGCRLPARVYSQAARMLAGSGIDAPLLSTQTITVVPSA